ncbi:hypothetical protein E4U22_000757 [Claviceps purpurea]|nr:hypothetical protein E4U22_000757 [Claviceps purpurea]
MVRIKSLMIAAVMAIAPVAQAACTPGLNYCATTLQTYGAGGASLASAIAAYASQKDKLLLRCNAGGSVTPIQICDNRCLDAGAGKSDYCTAFW